MPFNFGNPMSVASGGSEYSAWMPLNGGNAVQVHALGYNIGTATSWSIVLQGGDVPRLVEIRVAAWVSSSQNSLSEARTSFTGFTLSAPPSRSSAAARQRAA
jgi:hypothetical protein